MNLLTGRFIAKRGLSVRKRSGSGGSGLKLAHSKASNLERKSTLVLLRAIFSQQHKRKHQTWCFLFVIFLLNQFINIYIWQALRICNSLVNKMSVYSINTFFQCSIFNTCLSITLIRNLKCIRNCIIC